MSIEWKTDIRDAGDRWYFPPDVRSDAEACAAILAVDLDGDFQLYTHANAALGLCDCCSSDNNPPMPVAYAVFDTEALEIFIKGGIKALGLKRPVTSSHGC